MKAKIFLNQPLTQERYGLHFERGEALCDNEYIITKLQKKGVKVEILEEVKKEKTFDEMTVAELKEYATTNNIEIPSNVKNKADIIEFLKNYNPENTKEEEQNPETNTNEDETKIEEQNPEIKIDDGEDKEPKTE